MAVVFENFLLRKLQKELRSLRVYRMCHFGATAYQRISRDKYLITIPAELREIWYSNEVLSFRTLALGRSEIENMTQLELLHWILNECRLIARLHVIFADLPALKGGDING